MKLETKIFADAMLAEIKQYVAREVSGKADADRLADLIMRVQELEQRLAALERPTKHARVVRLS